MLSKISFMLDVIADSLEKKGLIKEAYEIDKIADEFDKVAYDEVEDDIEKIIRYLERISDTGTPIPAHKSEIGNYWVNENYRPAQLENDDKHYLATTILRAQILQRIYATDTGEPYKGTDAQFNEAKKLFLNLLKTSKTSSFIGQISEIIDRIKSKIKSW